MRGLDAFTFAVLVGAAFLAEHIAVPITPRSMFHASTPVVLLTGLLGGPLAGAAAGAVTAVPGIVNRQDAKRSVTYGGIVSLQGLLAGLAGLVTLDVGLTPQVLSAALASALFLTSNVVSRLLIGRSRHIPRITARPGTVSDAVEAVVVVPLLAALMVVQEEKGSAIVLAAVAATLFALWAFVQAHHSFIAELANVREHAARREERLKQKVRRLEREARTDHLTQLPNRRAYEEQLERAVELASRQGVGHGLLLVDLDHFKQINTDETMTGGDRVLCAAAQRMGEGLRTGDFLARRGGEEFVVIAPGIATEDDLRFVAEKVRGFVAAVALRGEGVARNVTVSIGATLVDGSAAWRDLDHLLNEAVIDAKETRNAVRVRLAEKPTLATDPGPGGLGSPSYA